MRGLRIGVGKEAVLVQFLSGEEDKMGLEGLSST